MLPFLNSPLLWTLIALILSMVGILHDLSWAPSQESGRLIVRRSLFRGVQPRKRDLPGPVLAKPFGVLANICGHSPERSVWLPCIP